MEPKLLFKKNLLKQKKPQKEKLKNKQISKQKYNLFKNKSKKNRSCKTFDIKNKNFNYIIKNKNYESKKLTKKLSVESIYKNKLFSNYKSKYRSNSNFNYKNFPFLNNRNLHKTKLFEKIENKEKEEKRLKKKKATKLLKKEKEENKNEKKKDKKKKKIVHFKNSLKSNREKSYFTLSNKSNKKDNTKKNFKMLIKEKNKKINDLLNKIDLNIILENEKFIYDFSIYINKEMNFYDIFKEYINFIQNYYYEPIFELLKLIKNIEFSVLTKTAFLLERTTLMICFYFLINDNYENEIIFFKKLINYIYSNISKLVEILVDNKFVKKTLEIKNKEKYSDFLKRKSNKEIICNSETIENNNKKIFKYIKFEVVNFEEKVSNSILKLNEFISDFFLEESSEILLKIFSELVK